MSAPVWPLRSFQFIGRDERCHVRVADDHQVSMCHASIAWDGTHWLLRDLGSTHGTVVNGEPLPPRVGHRLAARDSIGIGAHRWILEDADPPGLVLEPIPRGSAAPIHVASRVGVAVLPSIDDPCVTVVRTASGLWRVESDGDPWLLSTGAELRIGGLTFRAEVPEPHAATGEGARDLGECSIDRAELEIAVNHREEEADLTITVDGRRHRIVDRIPLYLLVLLARARAVGAGRAEGAELVLGRGRNWAADPEGWLDVEETCEQLGIYRELLNLHVFRVRECIRDLGIGDANQIIERRRNRLRIGVEPDRLRIVRRN